MWTMMSACSQELLITIEKASAKCTKYEKKPEKLWGKTKAVVGSSGRAAKLHRLRDKLHKHIHNLSAHLIMNVGEQITIIGRQISDIQESLKATTRGDDVGGEGRGVMRAVCLGGGSPQKGIGAYLVI